MNIAISHPFEFTDYAKLAATLDGMVRAGALPLTYVLCVEESPLVTRYARERGLPIHVYPYRFAYGEYGLDFRGSHGRQMVEACDGLVAFHNPRFRGTAHLIKLARERGPDLRLLAVVPLP
jgi:hypothetical protein